MAQYGENFYNKPFYMYTDGSIFGLRRLFWPNVEWYVWRIISHILSDALLLHSELLPYGNLMHLHDVLRTAFDNDQDLFCGHTWLGVDGDDGPFSAEGHFPVLAGYDVLGKELYVAAVEPSICSYVSDGARSLSIADRNGEVRVFSRFKVMVLRYDPFGIIECTIPDDAKLQTGYMYWVGDEKGIYKKYRSYHANPLEFSWARYDACHGLHIGVPKEEYEEKKSEVVKDDKDSLLEGGAEPFSRDITEQAVDALDTYDGVDAKAQEETKVEGETGIWEWDTSFIEEVQEECSCRRPRYYWRCSAGEHLLVEEEEEEEEYDVEYA